jgi:hypothetical protein
MLRNIREVKRSRLELQESDFQFYINQTGLSREEVERIAEVFDEKGGDLNRMQFKEVFETLNKNWLDQFKQSRELSDLIFRSFDKSNNF